MFHDDNSSSLFLAVAFEMDSNFFFLEKKM